MKIRLTRFKKAKCRLWFNFRQVRSLPRQNALLQFRNAHNVMWFLRYELRYGLTIRNKPELSEQFSY